jgi:transcriptional regulator with XRE-family HTH domain
MGAEFGGYIKRLREDRGLTLRQVEKKVKISNAYLSQVERGMRAIPTFKILEKLADVYGVSISDLTKRAEQEISKKKVDSKMQTVKVDFICRGYEKLNEEKKKDLQKYLQYLQQKGKKF